MHGNVDGQRWTDAHNHLHDPALRPWLVPGAPIAALSVVNATREADWPDVASLARARPDAVCPAFGLHPWHVAAAAPGWPSRLCEMLEEFPGAGVGECGLDDTPGKPAMRMQIDAFNAQVRIAREARRFLVVHCVKAWNPLFESLKQEPPPPAWMIHGFGASIELARRLAALGACFSISSRALAPHRATWIEAFRSLPPERILLETDAPNHPTDVATSHFASLAAAGTAIAARLGQPPDAFAELTRANLLRITGVAP